MLVFGSRFRLAGVPAGDLEAEDDVAAGVVEEVIALFDVGLSATVGQRFLFGQLQIFLRVAFGISRFFFRFLLFSSLFFHSVR